MSFKELLADYVNARITSHVRAGQQLPLRPSASQRAKRMRPEDRALDWVLQVQDQAAEVRKTIEANRSVGILQTEVEQLLYLLGEHTQEGHNGY